MPNLVSRMFFGVGPLILRNKTTGAARKIGEAPKLTETQQVEKMDTVSHIIPGGGLAASLTRVKGMELEIGLQHFSPENAALVSRGTLSSVAAGAVTAEVVVADVGGYASLAYLPDSITSVKDKTDTTTFTAGDDYALDGSMLYIPADSAIAALTPETDGTILIHVTYARLATDTVETLTDVQTEYEVIFDGVNEHDLNRRVKATYHRCVVSDGGSKDWISDAVRSGTLKLTVLADETQPSGASRYCREQYEGE